MIRRSLRRRFGLLLKSPLFWRISIWGNAFILGGALIFFFLEKEQNSKVGGFLDSLVWAVGTVTTVGSGDVHPVTVFGKILSIFMMLGGAIFLWSYMALFIGILVEPELGAIQKEVIDMQHELHHEEEAIKRVSSEVHDLKSQRTTSFPHSKK